MTRWYDGIAPATAAVACRGEAHRLTWRRGRVVVEDHDAPAEAALSALGGTPCPCLEVLDACRAGFDVDDLFMLWTEQAEPSVGASQALERWVRRARGTPAVPSPATRRAEERRAALLASLPLAFRRRLALGIFLAVAREPDDQVSASHPSFAPVFGSLFARAAAASTAPARSGGPLDVHWSLVRGDDTVRLDGRRGPAGATLRVGLSAGWVAEVWAWGLASLDGHLVVGVAQRASRCAVEVITVAWDEEGRPRPVRRPARRGPSGWRLEG